MRAYMVDVIAVEDDEGTTTKYWTTDGAYIGSDESAKEWKEFVATSTGAEPGMESSMPTETEYEPDDAPAAIRKRIRWLKRIGASDANDEMHDELERLERALKELQS